MPAVISSGTDILSCMYWYLLNPFVQDRQTRLYWHFKTLFTFKNFQAAVVDWKSPQSLAEFHILTSQLYSHIVDRNEQGQGIYLPHLGIIMSCFPLVSQELFRVREVFEKSNCLHEEAAYLQDVADASCKAAFGHEKKFISQKEFQAFLLLMSSDDENFETLKAVHKELIPNSAVSA